MTDIAPPEVVAPAPQKSKRPSFLLPVFVVAVLACGGYACWKYLPSSPKGATPAAAAANTASDVAAQVAKHVLVHPNETPMVATVQDPDALRVQNPVFYQDAQVGDKLLVWSDKAVLYSPSRDLVLAMLSMSAFNASNQSAATANAAPTTANTEPSKQGIKIEVRNGSTAAGLARKTADALKADGWDIVTIGDAKVKPVAKSEIFVSTKKALGTLPSSLANKLNGTVISSLGGEPTTTADILVIVGGDQQ